MRDSSHTHSPPKKRIPCRKTVPGRVLLSCPFFATPPLSAFDTALPGHVRAAAPGDFPWDSSARPPRRPRRRHLATLAPVPEAEAVPPPQRGFHDPLDHGGCGWRVGWVNVARAHVMEGGSDGAKGLAAHVMEQDVMWSEWVNNSMGW